MELDVWVDFDGNEMDTWKGGDWSKTMDGEYYKNRSPFFPNGHTVFYKAKALAEAGKFHTEYIDELTRFVIVPRSEIVKLLKIEEYELDHIVERLTELKTFIETLPKDKEYKLIFQEF